MDFNIVIIAIIGNEKTVLVLVFLMAFMSNRLTVDQIRRPTDPRDNPSPKNPTTKTLKHIQQWRHIFYELCIVQPNSRLIWSISTRRFQKVVLSVLCKLVHSLSTFLTQVEQNSDAGEIESQIWWHVFRNNRLRITRLFGLQVRSRCISYVDIHQWQ